MTNVKKENLITTIIDTVKTFRSTPICGRDQRDAYRRKKALRKKAVMVGAIVMLVTFLTCNMILVFAQNTEPDTTTYSTIAVEDGDTLWSIAKENFPNSDPRDIIQEIRDINGIDNHTIYAGMTLLVPAD